MIYRKKKEKRFGTLWSGRGKKEGKERRRRNKAAEGREEVEIGT